MTIDEHRSALLVLRNKVGADSEAGRLMSTLIEQLENYSEEPDPKARAWLEKFMANTTALLAAALAR
jgi:hypothetical protein